MRYQNIAFASFSTCGGREVTAKANQVIFFYLTECFIHLLSCGYYAQSIYVNRTPLVLGKDFHVPQQKDWIGSLLLELPRWKPMPLEDIVQEVDRLRVESMELSMSGAFEEKRYWNTKTRLPGSKEKHWIRIIQALDKYENNLSSRYPTRSELEMERRARRSG